MSVKQSDYEAILAEYSDRQAAIALLKQHRPYLEMIPSMRRAPESVIAIPLPVARMRKSQIVSDRSYVAAAPTETMRLPCDLALLMCDPEWKIKMGVEIIIFIHRPEEDFSHLLSRWRHTQVYLDRDYEWLMAPCDQHIFSEGAEQIYPLFIIFAETPERIKKGLKGASLPFLVHQSEILKPQEVAKTLS